jgi:CheY-like chemotaxis protein
MLRVLVIEDDQDTATTFAMLLRLYGYDVEVAADGPSALQVVQTHQPDVVLLDLAMPKMDGWQVAKQIRQRSIARRPFLIVVSGYGTEADRIRSYESGIDVHLVKPVDPAELEDLLKRFRSVIGDMAESSPA